MNDYKHNLICLVQKTPLLWDPRDKDYKNKDQRKQVWEKIDEKLPPPVEGCTAKDTWTSLTRSYNNALQRMKSKSGDGAGNSKPWMFMKSMSFLKVVKEKRSTTGNLGSSHDIAEDLDESASSIDDSSMILEQAARGSGIFDETNDTSQADDEDTLTDTPPRPSTPSTPSVLRHNSQESVVKRKASSKRRAEESEAALFQSLQRRLDEKSVARECPRMGFFKSLMPKIQSLTDDQFIEFQLKVLSNLKEVSQPVLQPIYYQQAIMPSNNMNTFGSTSEISNQESFLGLLNNPN